MRQTKTHWCRRDAMARDDPCRQGGQNGRQHSFEGWHGACRDKGNDDGERDPGIILKPCYDLEPDWQEYAAHHAHHHRQRAEAHNLAHPTGDAEHSDQKTGRGAGSNYFGEAQMIECRSDQDGTRYRPGNPNRLAIHPAHQDREKSPDRVAAENPRRYLVVRKASLTGDGEKDSERSSDGEEPCDGGVRHRMTIQGRDNVPQSGHWSLGWLQSRYGCRPRSVRRTRVSSLTSGRPLVLNGVAEPAMRRRLAVPGVSCPIGMTARGILRP